MTSGGQFRSLQWRGLRFPSLFTFYPGVRLICVATRVSGLPVWRRGRPEYLCGDAGDWRICVKTAVSGALVWRHLSSRAVTLLPQWFC